MPNPWEMDWSQPQSGNPAPPWEHDWSGSAGTAQNQPDNRALWQKIRDFPGEGANRAIAGAEQFIQDPSWHAAHEVLAGGAQAATPFAAFMGPVALVDAPAATLAGTAGAIVGGAIGKGGAKAVGASEDASNVVGDIGALAGGGLGAYAGDAIGDVASRLWSNPEARDVLISLLPRGAQINKLRTIAGALQSSQPDHAVDLDAVAKDWFGKELRNLTPDQQTKVRALADRLDKPIPPELNAGPAITQIPAPAPYYTPPAGLDTSAVPVSTSTAVLPEAFESASLRGPVRPPLAQPGAATPPAASAPPASVPPASGSSASTARQLFDAQKASGTIPADLEPGGQIPGPPEKPPEIFQEKARATRASSAQTMADMASQIPAEDRANMSTQDWGTVAKAAGVEFPTTKAAQTKLIRDTLKALGVKEGQTMTIGALMK